MRAAVLAAVLPGAAGYMYDTFSPELLPPTECAQGCAPWSTKDASIWRGGKVPADAGAKCAQVGSMVDQKTLGPWCYCNVSTPPAPPADHPLDGRVLAMKNSATGKYVSFAYTAAPSGLAGSTEWMRDQYGTNAEAMPLRFKAVAGKPNTYTMYNQWPGYEKWVSFTWTKNYLRAWYSESDAMPVELVSQGDGKYKMINQYSDPRAQGKYLNLDSNTWLQTVADEADAAVVSFEDATGPGSALSGYCTHGNAVPEQINVQIGSPDTVVVSFVTFESAAPKSPPTAFVGQDKAKLTAIQGVTHVHTTSAGDRTYYMHFVRVSSLRPRERYYYKVQSGGQGAAQSAVFSFRAPYPDGETKINIYGDMGVYSYNNMQQLYDDCVVNEDVDFVVHMGDHAYNEGDSDERRADGYFNAFQETIAQCPWMPVVGNHEYYAGAKLGRYLDSTWEKWGPIAGGDVPGNEFAGVSYKGTSTTALGAMLTTGLHHGVGTLGANPSGTSRYFSADVGLVHIIALDLNLYYGLDPCGDSCRKEQLTWLEADLKAANANREKVPWVAALSHFPLFCSGCHGAESMPLYYGSEEAERFGNGNRTAAAAFSRDHPELMERFARQRPGKGLGAYADASINDLYPLFEKYSLDIYLAGHWHYYESMFPLKKGPSSCLSCAVPVQKDFVQPNVTVHVTTGNGGPPGKDSFCKDGKGAPDCGSIPATRRQTDEFSYGRMTVHNRTHLTFQQFFNANGSVFDEWTIVQSNHPFHE
eukprot:TRINITY_DN2242_c0_g1_i1.p1 TRINITY_DN2242_c0_g1~~TRINITY_DN2242_c0_g1_i1.p1  ORF type:complete len:772 (+),score=296.86 TRINITY_DN2242_c0_g1_i1:54-2318(+)